jgi:hypothetical protein
VRSFPAAFPILLTVTLGLAGCQSSAPGSRAGPDSIPQEAPTPASTGDLSREELRSATRLYTAKCARCHKFYNPADYSDQEWHTWMTKMSRKARLKPDQAQLLSRYLETFRPAQKTNGK